VTSGPALAALLLTASLALPGAGAGELEVYQGPEQPLLASLPDTSGRERSLGDYQGQVLLVNFWASWCGPCIGEIPSLRTLRERLDDEPFEVLAINVEENPFKVQKFTGLVSMPFPILLDRDRALFEAWGARVLPTSYLLDAAGKVRYRVQGPLDWSSEDIVDKVRSLLPDDAGP